MYFSLLETCPRLNPVNVDLTCHRAGKEIDCNDQMFRGTSVRPRCKPQYRSERNIDYRELKCREDGEWDNELFECVTGNEKLSYGQESTGCKISLPLCPISCPFTSLAVPYSASLVAPVVAPAPSPLLLSLRWLEPLLELNFYNSPHLLRSDCGLPKATNTSIQPSSPTEWKPAHAGDSPWNVAVYWTGHKELLCGGTIISPYMVVSGEYFLS